MMWNGLGRSLQSVGEGGQDMWGMLGRAHKTQNPKSLSPYTQNPKSENPKL